MKSIYKLTPWILLAAIIIVLVISYFMNKSSGHIEGFTTGNYYDGNTELKNLHDNIYFDEINGSLVFANDDNIKVLNRNGSTTLPTEHNEIMEKIVEARKFTHNIIDETTGENKYTVFYSAIGKHTNIYIFGYTNTTDADDNTTQEIALIGSYAFAIDNTNCVSEGSDSGSCDLQREECESGVGYNDGNSYKCCTCTPEYADKNNTFTEDEGKITGLTSVDEIEKVGTTSGTARISKYDTDISLERIISNTILFDKKMGNLVLIDSHENDGNSVEPSIINHKNENIKNTEELTKTEDFTSLFSIHKNILILYSYYSNNINVAAVQLVNKAESSPELELILSKHYIIDAPNTNSSVTSSMSTSSSSNENTSTQDVGDMIYNRVSNKIADLVDREFDKVLNPDASTDDKYILKTQVVPPVCPTCPNCVSSCKDGGVCSNCGGNGGSGTKTESGNSLAAEKKKSSNNPVSNVIGETGNVAEQTVGAAGDLVTTTATATGNLVKTTAGTAVDVIDSTVGGVTRDLYSGTKGVAGDVYGATTDVAGDVYGTATDVVGDLYGGAKALTTDVYGGIKNLGPDSVRGHGGQVPSGVTNTGSNIGVTQRTAYSNTGSQPSNIYNYYGALPNKETRYVPITSDFSAFGR